jgi:hypothetical protein
VPSEISPSTTSQVEGNTKPAEAKVPTSKLKFKIVDEMYAVSSITRAFLIFCFTVEIIIFPDIRSWNQYYRKRWANLNKYVFVIRIRVGKLIKIWNFIILRPSFQRKILLNERFI